MTKTCRDREVFPYLSFSCFLFIAMDLSASWVPTSNGNVLSPFTRLTEVVEGACTPHPRSDKPWLKSSFSDIFAKFPHAQEAVWGTVLSLWRLKTVAPDIGESADDALWEEHVVAWLVSALLWSNGERLADFRGGSIVIAISVGTWRYPSSRSSGNSPMVKPRWGIFVRTCFLPGRNLRRSLRLHRPILVLNLRKCRLQVVT